MKPLATTEPLSPQIRFRLAILTAGLWWAAGAFSLFPLGWFCTAPFFLGLCGLSPRERFRWGYFTGILSFALINWWLIPTITRGAPGIGIPLPLAFLLSLISVACIALIHGFGLGLVGLAWNHKGLWGLLAAPLVWVAWEWLRCQGPLAHSWGVLAYSQASDPRLLRNIPYTYGLSYLCVAYGAGSGLLLYQRRVWRICSALLVLLLAHLPVLPAPVSHGVAARVLVVQTTLPTSGPGAGDPSAVFAQAYRLTARALEEAKDQGRDIDLVVWPETAVLVSRHSDGRLSGLEWATLRTEGFHVPVLTGALVNTSDGGRANEAILLLPDGSVQSYAKRRLVPFGERAPFSWLAVLAPQPAVTPGAAGHRLFVPGRSLELRPLICFESCFPGASWEAAANPATPAGTLGVVLTNDQWFAGTEAPREHRAMGILRAAESRRPFLQCANGGYSFATDAEGRVVHSLPFGAEGTFEFEVPKTESGTQN